jgi:predicted dehydrogenase
MDDPLTRIGVVGYGYWGSKHVRVLAGMPEVELAVIEQDEHLLEQAQRSFPAVTAATALDDVIERLDAVVVATPPGTHWSLGMTTLEAGRHCLIEKPLATSVAEAEQLVDAAAAARACLMVGHTFEYNAAVWKLKEILAAGELGEVLYIDTARLSLGRYQHDCNVIWDLAPHDISIVTHLLDEVPSSVSVWAQWNVGAIHADVAYLRMEFARSRATAFVHVSWLDPRKVRRVTVAGRSKMAVYNDMSDERVRVYDVGVDPADASARDVPHAMPVTYRSGDIVSPYIQFSEPLLVQDRHFVECVRWGSTPATPGERGLDIVRVLAAADVAMKTGRPAEVAADRGAPTPDRNVEIAL